MDKKHIKDVWNKKLVNNLLERASKLNKKDRLLFLAKYLYPVLVGIGSRDKSRTLVALHRAKRYFSLKDGSLLVSNRGSFGTGSSWAPSNQLSKSLAEMLTPEPRDTKALIEAAAGTWVEGYINAHQRNRRRSFVNWAKVKKKLGRKIVDEVRILESRIFVFLALRCLKKTGKRMFFSGTPEFFKKIGGTFYAWNPRPRKPVSFVRKALLQSHYGPVGGNLAITGGGFERAKRFERRWSKKINRQGRVIRSSVGSSIAVKLTNFSFRDHKATSAWVRSLIGERALLDMLLRHKVRKLVDRWWRGANETARAGNVTTQVVETANKAVLSERAISARRRWREVKTSLSRARRNRGGEAVATARALLKLKAKLKRYPEVVDEPFVVNEGDRLITSTVLHKINQKYTGQDRLDTDDNYYKIEYDSEFFNEKVKTYFFEKFRLDPINNHRLTAVIASVLAREGKLERMRKVLYEVARVTKFGLGRKLSEVFDEILKELRPEFINYLHTRGRKSEYMPRPASFHQMNLFSLKFFKKRLISRDSRNAAGKSVKVALFNEIESHLWEVKGPNTELNEYTRLSAENLFLIGGAITWKKNRDADRLKAYNLLIGVDADSSSSGAAGAGSKAAAGELKFERLGAKVNRHKSLFLRLKRSYDRKVSSNFYTKLGTAELIGFKARAPKNLRGAKNKAKISRKVPAKRRY